ncbi:MAG TPA: biosynthetic peptidoglycan transglycosylase [Solirubrobacteraceae bacterium]|nr:biosynthetic peptidoglycan transglycosylase [Solirubrobacteraceae bacterium]
MRRAALAVAALVVLFLAAGGVYLLTLPGVGDAPARADRIMAAHGESVRVRPTPARLADAVIATEDEHFDDNIVVNVVTGAGRAALAAVQASQDPGGSTIDQQLAKALYGDTGGLFGTLRQIGLGVKLALTYSKQQILAMYLNVNYYGQGYWGVTQAAEGYFHTAPASLSWAEASMLAGLLQAPSAYDPVVHFALAKKRQRHVLDQLVANGQLTRSEAAAVYDARLPLTSS